MAPKLRYLAVTHAVVLHDPCTVAVRDFILLLGSGACEVKDPKSGADGVELHDDGESAREDLAFRCNVTVTLVSDSERLMDAGDGLRRHFGRGVRGSSHKHAWHLKTASYMVSAFLCLHAFAAASLLCSSLQSVDYSTSAAPLSAPVSCAILLWYMLEIIRALSVCMICSRQSLACQWTRSSAIRCH
jgi:hypothetical protein